MSLIVNNVINSSSQISYSYLGGEEVFGYLINLNYTIKTQDISFDNNDGVLLTGRAAIRQAYKRRNITARIAGDEILNGLITQVSFSESSLVGEDTVSVSIEERRRLDDYSSKNFSKYIPSPHLLTEFSEKYSFSRSGSEYSYNRDISIKYAQDLGDQFLNNAKAFLTNYYFSNRPSIGYYEDGISENARFNNGYNGTLTENIDLVNLSVSLNEVFNSSFISDSEGVSKDIDVSLSVDNKGYLNKRVSVKLTSLRYDSQNVLEQAIANTIDQIISDEESDFGKPFSIQKGVKKDSNTADLTIEFSTDPKRTQEDLVTYTCEKSKDQALFNYTLVVEYKSKGPNVKARYDNTLSLWESSKDENMPKVLRLFPEATSIYEKSRSVNLKKSAGGITENIIFSTDEGYNSSGLPSGIVKYSINVSKQEKIKRNSVVLDLINLKQKLVTSNLDRLGSASVTATATCDQAYGIFHAKDFLASKTSEMNNHLEEETYYATTDVMQIDLSSGTATRVINYIIA
jgi:hypothetical protein